MIIESKYGLQETISRLESNIHHAEYKWFMPLGLNSSHKYMGTVSEERFRIFEGSIRKPLTIAGRVYEKDGKVYISFWPEPNINHILFLILCTIAVVVFLIRLEWWGILGVIILSSIITLFEFSRLKGKYDDFKDFVSELVK